MARAVEAGQRVVCVTATRGELGVQDPERWPPERLGDIRTEELEASLRVLGITEHIWFDYPDGGCAGNDGTDRVAALIDDVRPDSVLTFGPDGMTGHEDHIAVGAWADEAFARAARPGALLFHATKTKAWADRFVPIMAPHNVFMLPGTPPVSDPEDIAIDFQAEGPLNDLKAEAIGMHLSQIEGLRMVMGPDTWRDGIIEETFRLVRQR